MTERDFQTRFTRWARHNIKESCACELKICKTKTLPFSAVKVHQRSSLLAAKKACLVYKIPDVGFDQKPFDCVILNKTSAYLVVLFHVKRGDNEFYMIDIDTVEDIIAAGRKSIDKETAKEAATYIGTLA
jgi:hypothetical protein